MTTDSKQKAIVLAKQRISMLVDQWTRQRSISIACSILCVLLAVIVTTLGFAFAGFCLVLLLFISILRLVDITGQLREIRQRSKNSLAPDFSLLQPGPESSEADAAQTHTAPQ